MEFKRKDNKLRKIREKEYDQLKRFSSIHKGQLYLVGGILGLVAVAGLWFGTEFMSDPIFDETEVLNSTPYVPKHVVVNEDSFKVFKDGEESVDMSTDNTGSGTFVVSGDAPQLGKGSLITDTSVNPRGIPMYNGYTNTNGFYVDYSRFWEIEGVMNGLGDFTNKEARNAVSFEFAKNDLSGEGTKYVKKMSDAKAVGGYWTAEGRLCIALPPGAIIEPDVYEPLIDSVWANTAKYTDHSSWTEGAPALSYVAGIFDNRLIGLHVDCVLDDGTVLALILMDTKALHTGICKGTQLCKDNEVKGYAHWRGYADTGKKSYMGILEVGITRDYKSSFDANKKMDLHLDGHKIAGFMVYPETKGRFQ